MCIYVPHPLRNTLLHDMHDTTHPGLRTTLREATRLYYWPHMNRDVMNWTKACLHCQAAKVTKHNTTAPIIMAPSSSKFHDIHLDIVEPLYELKGMHYILTAVDRFSCWTMAGPWQNLRPTSSPAQSLIPSSEDGCNTMAFLTPSPQIEGPISSHYYLTTYSKD